MYLKEGDIGKAESEEVVPAKTEMKITSQIGSAVRSPGSSFLAPASQGTRTGCRWQSPYGGLTPGRALPPLAHLIFTATPRERKLHCRWGNRLGKWHKSQG